MGLFSKILDKLGLNKDKQADEALAEMAKKEAEARAKMAAPKPAVSAPAAKPVTPAAPAPAAKPVMAAPNAEVLEGLKREPAVAAPVAGPTAISEVDVVKKLEQMTEGSGLDWKVSIVDLLKVLKIDSSLNARKELAQELGCPSELIGGDYSKMNIWLHKTVLKKIAENGGNIPANLLD